MSVLALALVLPSSGAGATTVGETLAPDVACPAGLEVFGESASASQRTDTPYIVPSSAVFTSWSTMTAANGSTMAFKVYRKVVGGIFVVGESTGETTAPNTTGTYAIRIPAEAGDYIGFVAESGNDCFNSTQATTNDVIWLSVGTNTAPGDTNTTGSGANENVLPDISAQLEPDADHDGYGDQTQDKCYTDPSSHPHARQCRQGPHDPLPEDRSRCVGHAGQPLRPDIDRRGITRPPATLRPAR
jgi:hypothetical protein